MRYFFIKNLKKLHGSFLWIGFDYLKAAEPLRGDSLFLKTKSSRLLVTNIGLGRLWKTYLNETCGSKFPLVIKFQ